MLSCCSCWFTVAYVFAVVMGSVVCALCDVVAVCARGFDFSGCCFRYLVFGF